MKLSDFKRLLDPLRISLRQTAGLGIVDSTDDSGAIQRVAAQIGAGEVRSRLLRLQQYGFTSRPRKGFALLWLAIGGSRTNLAAVTVDDEAGRKRDLQEGESAVYTDEGDYILLKNGRIIEVVSGTRLKVTAPEAIFDCPKVDTTGKYYVDGVQVVEGQGAAVPDPVGGATVDAQARAQLSLLLARIRAHGLIAP